MPTQQIPVGMKGEHSIIVTDGIAIDFINVEGG